MTHTYVTVFYFLLLLLSLEDWENYPQKLLPLMLLFIAPIRKLLSPFLTVPTTISLLLLDTFRLSMWVQHTAWKPSSRSHIVKPHLLDKDSLTIHPLFSFSDRFAFSLSSATSLTSKFKRVIALALIYLLVKTGRVTFNFLGPKFITFVFCTKWSFLLWHFRIYEYV